MSAKGIINSKGGCKTHRVGLPMPYKRKSRYANLAASELKRIKEPAAEATRLKGMNAEQAMETEALRVLIIILASTMSTAQKPTP